MSQYVSSVTRKGQVTIPVEIRRLLRVSARDKVAFLVEADEVRIVPAKGVVARTAGMLRGNEPMLLPQEEKIAVEEAIAEEAVTRGG